MFVVLVNPSHDCCISFCFGYFSHSCEFRSIQILNPNIFLVIPLSPLVAPFGMHTGAIPYPPAFRYAQLPPRFISWIFRRVFFTWLVSLTVSLRFPGGAVDIINARGGCGALCIRRLLGVEWICCLAVSGNEVFLFGCRRRGGVVLCQKGWMKEGSVI